MKRTAVILSVGAAGVVFAAADARAQDGTPTVIYACIQKDGGAQGSPVRIVDAKESCDKRERKIYWNVMGPMGPQGPQGAKGLKGDTGPKGDTGGQGPKGDSGAQGAKGDRGDTGAQGLKGDTGAQGPKGDGGPKGDTGAKGDTGPKGDSGSKGDQGPTGPMGLGFTFRGGWDASTEYSPNDVVLSGGSSYVALVDNVGVLPSADPTSWSLFAAKGDQGDPGARGDTGPQGNPGSIGPQGPQGPKGDTGSQGVSGTTGQNAFTVGTGTRTGVATLNVLTDLSLAASVNVTAATGAVVLSTDGGIQVNSTSGAATAVVNILLLVDNTTFVTGRQYILSNNTGFVGITNWSFTTSMNTLTPGWHTFKVFAQYAGGTAPVWVGGMPGSLLQGALTVTQLNK